MNSKKLCILICSTFAAEADVVVRENGWKGVTIVPYPNRCGRPPLSWDEVRQLAGDPNVLDCIVILGGCCLSALKTPPQDLSFCTVTSFEYCFEMVAGKKQIQTLIRNGSYLVTPGWLAGWRDRITEWGFERDTARQFFSEFARQVVLLDTDILQNAGVELQQFAEYTGLECDTLPVGRDLFSQRLAVMNEQCNAVVARKNELAAQRQSADYAIAFELLSNLARTIDENEVMEQIKTMYRMLFAAADVNFLSAGEEPADGYCLLQNGDGFVLPITSGDEVLTVVTVAGITMPQYVQLYLTLALSTVSVCGLAIRNARLFREIADKNRQLEDAHQQLQQNHLHMLQQEKMASIGQLAAGVAHEINNPMGFITSNMGTLAKYMGRIREFQSLVDAHGTLYDHEVMTAREKLKIDFILNDSGQLLEECLDGAVRVKAIVDDLKNFSRADKPEAIWFDLNHCIESALNISANEIKYVADVVKKLGTIPEVLCHPQQLTQVFINLFANAGQAMAGRGTITVKSWQEECFVCVSVSDTGCGIAPENLRSIFDPFFTTKGVGKGTGLGLSISYNTVKSHGGEISVESSVGIGTTFTVRLPVGGGEP